ncbi:MAG: hypothetical protein M0Q42_12315 [Xanthomonadales bacterium]|nr:hypothetical protein [Xanthomonadales bacterium]
MEFHIHLDSRPDLTALGAVLQRADPAALVDFQADTGRLRIATWLEAADIVEAFGDIDHPLAVADIELQPSVCCGGCSG